MIYDMQVNEETCRKCGICAIVCPARAINHSQGEFPSPNSDRAQTCILCGQCMAICPKGSISISGLSYKDLFDLPENTPDYQAFFDLLSTRRSIRNFKDQPVPRELIEQIIQAIAQAPMGFPPHKTHVTVVQDRSTILKILPIIIKIYEDMLAWMKNPVIRFVIKHQTTPETFTTIKNHLLPLMSRRLPEMKKANSDEITWGAPVLILFHAYRLAETHTVDAHIALTYAFLASHALGLGATVSGLIPPAVNNSSELRNMLKIPQDHEVVCCIMLGYPRYKFQHGIKRPLASINWI
jgi:ferredoxin